MSTCEDTEEILKKIRGLKHIPAIHAYEAIAIGIVIIVMHYSVNREMWTYVRSLVCDMTVEERLTMLVYCAHLLRYVYHADNDPQSEFKSNLFAMFTFEFDDIRSNL